MKPATGDQSRIALAEVIRRADAAMRELRDAENAVKAAVLRRIECEERLEQHRSAAVSPEASPGLATAFIAAVAHGAMLDVGSLTRSSRADREKEQLLLDEIELLQNAEKACRAVIPERSSEVYFSNSRLNEAARTVLRTAFKPQLIAQVTQFYDQLERARAMLLFLSNNDGVPEEQQSTVRGLVLRGLSPNGDAQIYSTWKSAVEELKRDANAKLPEI